jgi:hypothetical protein
MPGNFIPVTVIIAPTQVTGGSTVDVTVILNGSPDSQQEVAISGTPSGFWEDLVKYVFIGPNTDRTTFQAEVAKLATGTGTITAACNNGSAQGNCTVV